MEKVPAPVQLNLDFERPGKEEVAVEATVVSSIPVSFSVLDISEALEKKREARTTRLYQQILESVEHIR